jgi:hypothetical protein
MKKTIINSLLFILSFVSISKAQAQEKGFYLGLNGSIDRSDIDVTGGNKDFRKVLENPIKARLGYTAGINLLYRFTDKVSLETGVFYSNKGTVSKYYFSAVDSFFVGGTLKITSVYHFIDLPLKANIYILRKKKVQLFLAGGLAANIFLFHQTKYQTDIPGIYVGNSNDIKRIGISVLGSLGMDLPVSSRLFVRVEPTFKRSLTRISETGPIKSYLYNSGLNLGIYYKL